MDHHDSNQDDHGEENHCWYQGGPFAHELTSHLPFSILSVTVGLILAGLISVFAGYGVPGPLGSEPDASDHVTGEDAHEEMSLRQPVGRHDQADHSHGGFIVLFHLFHPAHMLFSAAATAGLFWRYERNGAKAVAVGLSGAILICGISDILMPYASALIMGKELDLHICIVEHPMLVIPFAGVGVVVGILAASGEAISTLFSHSVHVACSTMASIFYLIGAFGRFEWIDQLGVVFLFICLAVVLPCCLSDIVYPLLFTPQARSHFLTKGHHH